MPSIQAMLVLPALAAAAVIDQQYVTKRQLPGLPKVPDFFGIEKGALTVSTPYKVRKLKSEYDEKAIHERVMFGPFTIKGSNDKHEGDGGTVRLDANSDAITTRLSGLCQNCMVLKAAAEVVTANDTKAGLQEGLYGHHVLVVDIGATSKFPPLRSDPACEAKMGNGFELDNNGVLQMGGTGMGGTSGHDMRRFMAPTPGWWENIMGTVSRYLLRSMVEGGALGSLVERILPAQAIMIGEGGESTPMVFATKDKVIKSGFWIAEDHRINAMSEVINYNKESRQVFMTIDYEYLPNIGRERPEDYYDVTFGALGVTCGQLDLHPDKTKATKYTGSPVKVMQDGYLTGIIPHLHDGGVNLTVSVNGKAKCTSQAIYGGSGANLTVAGKSWETITAYENCDKAIPLKKGDELLVETVYDLTQHQLRPSSGSGMMATEGEGMGLALITFAKEARKQNKGWFGLR